MGILSLSNIATDVVLVVGSVARKSNRNHEVILIVSNEIQDNNKVLMETIWISLMYIEMKKK